MSLTSTRGAGTGGGEPWEVRLFGRVQASKGDATPVDRFRTQRTADLLAFLALHRGTQHRRTELIGLLWPEQPPEGSGRMSLAVALSSLRSQLEPMGVTPRSVLLADATHVGLHPDAVTTDVVRFEEMLDRADSAEPAGRSALLRTAVALYGPGLLPDTDATWARHERDRLAARCAAARRALA